MKLSNISYGISLSLGVHLTLKSKLNMTNLIWYFAEDEYFLSNIFSLRRSQWITKFNPFVLCGLLKLFLLISCRSVSFFISPRISFNTMWSWIVLQILIDERLTSRPIYRSSEHGCGAHLSGFLDRHSYVPCRILFFNTRLCQLKFLLHRMELNLYQIVDLLNNKPEVQTLSLH